ncbi:phage tail protein [Caldimonas thermodepolymerans]|nr:phage tail protein [Caldimonas thermodepolymerans]
MAGSMVGSLLFRETIKHRQPVLSDLKVTRGAYGHVLPYVEGAMRVGGWIAWASDRRRIDHTTTQGGKGGPKVETTTSTYEVDVLVLLTCNRIAGVRRIWQDGELVWSRAAESDLATITNSGAFARRVTVYTGAPDQLPDPTYEAAVGVGNAPAYRERGSVFIEGWDLGSSGQIRNLTFEVYTAGVDAVHQEDVAVISVPSGAGTIRLGAVGFDSDGFTVSYYEPPQRCITKYEVSATDGADFVRRRRITVPYTLSPSVPRYSTSDVSGVLVGTPSYETTREGTWFGDNNSVVEYKWPSGFASTDNTTFARSGNLLVIGSTTSPVHGRLHLYSATNGAEIASTPDLGKGWGIMAIVGRRLYASVAFTASGGIDVFDLSGPGINLVGNIDAPANGASTIWLFGDEAGRLYCYQSTNVYRRDGSQWTLLMSGVTIFSLGTTDISKVRMGISRGVFWAVVVNDASSTVTIKAAWLATALQPVPLKDAVEHLIQHAGLPLEKIDASALASKSTRGFAIAQATTARAALDMLASAYFFEAVKDAGIRFVNRGGAPVATIPYEDLGSVDAGGEPGEPLPMTDGNDIEIPAHIAVRYANFTDDFQDGAEHSDRLVTESVETRVVDLSIAMTPTEARRLAQCMAMDLQASKVRIGPIVVQRKYAALQPTDVVLVEDRHGNTVRMRITKRDEAGGLIRIDGVVDDPSVVLGTVPTDTNYSGGFTITPPGRTNWLELDVPLLSDQYDYPSFEVAFGSTSATWHGAVYYGGDDDASLSQLTSVNTETVIGVCVTELPAWHGGNLLDVVSTVDVQTDGELSSVTYEQLMAGANAAAITSAGRTELLHFMTAELIGARTYRLRNFLRYRKGTDGVTHEVGDRFVLLQPQGMRVVAAELARLGQERRYKAVSVGRPVGSVDTIGFAWTAEKLKPLAPFNVRGARDGSGDLTITWNRRTRYSDNWLRGIVPLGEAREAYEVEILSGSTVKRVLTSSTPSVVYSAADQAADFGSVPSSVSVRVYQLSDVIGRGYAASATV